MNDTQVLDWLLKNVSYMEHNASKELPYNFWPHDNSDPIYIFQEDKLGLTLRQYVEARIREESDIHPCPKCGSEVTMAHYSETASTPEAWVPSCTECTWQGQPE